MENKILLSAGDMAKKLIWYVLLWGLLFEIVAGILGITLKNLLANGSSFFTALIISGIAGFILAFIQWKLTIFTVFRKYTTESVNISEVMKKLLIIVLIFWVVTVVLDIAKLSNSIKKLDLEYNNQIEKYEKYEKLYSPSYVQTFKSELQNTVDEAKSIIYTGFIGGTIISLVIDIVVVLLQKKSILKNCV